MKEIIFYNQKHNSMWLCVKEHGNKSFENMWCFYRIKNGRVDINFYNPDCEEKLNKLIEASQTVYGYGITPMASSLWNMNGPEKERGPHTHQAKLQIAVDALKEIRDYDSGPSYAYCVGFLQEKARGVLKKIDGEK